MSDVATIRQEVQQLKGELTDLRRETTQAQTVLYRTLGLAVQLTGDEDLRRGIVTMQRAISIANQLRLALIALQAARMAAGDPLAWAMAGVTVAEFVVNTGQFLESEVRGR